jgi:Glyoxalase-like domain
MPTIEELLLADDPQRWAEVGFVVRDGCCVLGEVRLRFVESADAPGIAGWALRDLASAELDGLPTTASTHPAPTAQATDSADVSPAHLNGAVAIDHVVVMSHTLDRSVAALQRAGLQLRRIREQPTPAGAPRQAFFRLGGVILEVIQVPDEVVQRTGGPEVRARFWGLALRAPDLDRTVASLGEHAGTIRPAVQPGRRIATLRRSAGLAVPLAFISEPAAPEPRPAALDISAA